LGIAGFSSVASRLRRSEAGKWELFIHFHKFWKYWHEISYDRVILRQAAPRARIAEKMMKSILE
jgi:hypothetical protein